MSTLYLLVDSATNIVEHAQVGAISTAPTGQYVATIDSSVPYANNVFGTPTAYVYEDGALTPLPTFSLTYENNLLTTTLSTATTSTVTFTVADTTFSTTPSGTSAKQSLALHPSVAMQDIPVTVSATGFYSLVQNIGGLSEGQNVQRIGLQVYTPSGGIPTVAPVGVGSIEYLQGYYALAVTQAHQPGDVFVWVTLLGQLVHLLATATTATIDSNTNNLLSDLNTVLLQSPVTIFNAAPVPTTGGTQNYDPNYDQARIDYLTAVAALSAYETSRTTIPGLE